jgi:hypothetical protein
MASTSFATTFVNCDSLTSESAKLCKFTQELSDISYETSNLDCRNKIGLDTKEVLFIFEGGGVNSPRYFNIVNNEAKIKAKFPGPIYNQIYNAYANSLFELRKSNSYTTRFLRAHNVFTKDRVIFYFKNSNVDGALACHQQVSSKNTKVLAMSWGSNGAHKFIKELNRINEPIKAVIFFDPVRKGFLAFSALRNILTSSNSRFYKKLSNTELFINHYQKTYDGSLSIAKVRGNSIPSADINLNLSKNCLSKNEEIPFVRLNHKNIFNCPTLVENIKLFLRKGN